VSVLVLGLWPDERPSFTPVSDIESKIIHAFCINISILVFFFSRKKKTGNAGDLSSGKDHPLNGSCAELNVARNFGIAALLVSSADIWNFLPHCQMI